ncbi:MAG: hypothetical protein A2Z59_05310 [Nitrospinae bacterium RIFCSPLOWO2_02_39_17]|nr:MAG: hypothetical protein A2W53_00760 [Nitrospinae bacterium RIFCSPHIGHO2_02_39_11]OGV98709.1 MAG: hypothetical protein A3D97_07780 [Nitrospinae bacterium RIFCSPHIGHO2_12_FULL_39_42]OGW07303.1 MAG: hypothetical protein A2Z59_05310 [Nitrospinae bacterium RIFCSPLOWO2_02_39_17]OGW11287.1 MAG: hypothetical protein A2W75_09420 [Nitrospinae bacterium RIFCSPLOWO2_12_39_15]OHC02678.1 MAG: hypothetical protein A2Z57_10460 [Planctomycetes bacterium RIFCSPHIGHO2_12_39_6]
MKRIIFFGSTLAFLLFTLLTLFPSTLTFAQEKVETFSLVNLRGFYVIQGCKTVFFGQRLPEPDDI